METDQPDGAHSAVEPGPFDSIAADLQLLRAKAGLPSYNELVVRITSQRESRGVAPGAARPARTTVYDAFRPGRRRLDAALVGDIARALGADEAEVQVWDNRVALAHRPADGPDPVPATVAEPVPDPVPATSSDGLLGANLLPFITRLPPRRWVVAILVGCVVLNLLGRITVDYLGLSVFLDMVGTAVAAVVLGPWWGALVGLTTNLAGASTSGAVSIPFAIVNVAGALIWGFGVRRLGLGRTLPQYFLLNLIVALVCTGLSAPIIVMLGGGTGHGSDDVIDTLVAATHHLVVSVVAGNLLPSVADKMISGFLALVAAEACGRSFLDHQRHSAPASH